MNIQAKNSQPKNTMHGPEGVEQLRTGITESCLGYFFLQAKKSFISDHSAYNPQQTEVQRRLVQHEAKNLPNYRS
jgi:hypothetical protein